ncbi:hypothetical protein D9M72_552130 [compost metagenome]
MAMSRSFGATSLTMRPSMRISPPLMSSSPASIRRSVDLPQPDGPTSVTNSPSSIFTETPWMTEAAPYCFKTRSIVTDAIVFLP